MKDASTGFFYVGLVLAENKQVLRKVFLPVFKEKIQYFTKIKLLIKNTEMIKHL